MGVDAGNQALMMFDGSCAIPEPHLLTKFGICIGRVVLLSHEEIKLPSQSVCVMYYVVVKIYIYMWVYIYSETSIHYLTEFKRSI